MFLWEAELCVVSFQTFLPKKFNSHGQLHPLHGFHGAAGEFRSALYNPVCVYE